VEAQLAVSVVRKVEVLLVVRVVKIVEVLLVVRGVMIVEVPTGCYSGNDSGGTTGC